MAKIQITANSTAVQELDAIFKDINLESMAEEVERGYSNIWLIYDSDEFILEQIEESILDGIERANPFLIEEIQLVKIED